jgi:ribosomal-protein-alanine N-acetyltransferase
MNTTEGRVVLKKLHEVSLNQLKEYLVKNRTFLAQWEPTRDDQFFSEEAITQDIQQKAIDVQQGNAVHYGIYLRGTYTLIGTISVTNIIRGAFLSCFLGYKLDQDHVNKGFMTEALTFVIKDCFTNLGLHRIEANVMPRNIPSKRVLEKLGFVNEGMSKNYLRIYGQWEDHEHYVLLNSELE